MSFRAVPLLIVIALLVMGGAWLATGSSGDVGGIESTPSPAPFDRDPTADTLVAEASLGDLDAQLDPSTQESTPRRTEVVDPALQTSGPTLRVIEATSQQPVAAAEVFVSDQVPEGRANRADASARWLESLQRTVTARRTNAQGEVQLPQIRRRMFVVARAPGLFGAVIVREDDARPTLTLMADRTLRVRVLDASGMPAAGVDVALCADLGPRLQRLVGARSGDDGIALLPHVQLYATRLPPSAPAATPQAANERLQARVRELSGRRARGDRRLEQALRLESQQALEVLVQTQRGERERMRAWAGRADAENPLRTLFSSPDPATLGWPLAEFVVAAELPQAEPAQLRVAANAVPAEVVDLRLPTTTTITLRVLGPQGHDFTAPCRVLLRATSALASADAKRQSLEEICVLRGDKPAATGAVQLGPIGLGLRLHAALRFADNDFDFDQGDLVGPTSPGTFTIILRVPGWMTCVAGRLIDAVGRPVTAADIDLFVVGQKGRVEGERVAVEADGRFELPLRLREPAPPYTLEVQARTGERRFGCLASLPQLVVGGRHEIGDLVWKELPVLVTGVVRDDRAQPIVEADIELQSLRGAAWTQESFVRGRTDTGGAFTLYGEPRDRRLRLRAQARGHSAVEREFTFGERVEIVLLRQGSVHAEGLLPAFVATETLQATLTDLASTQTREVEVRKPAPDRFVLHAAGLRAGTWQLTFQVRGLRRPLAVVDRVQVPPGDTVRPDRIDGLDLRGRLFQFQIRAVDQAGQTMGDPGSPLFVQLHDAVGAPHMVPFPWSGGQIELVTDAPSLSVVGLSGGHAPARALLQAGASTLPLLRVHPLHLKLPGLRALLGSAQPARISLVYADDTGLPAADLQATQQRGGQTRGYARANLGKSGGASLGAGDEVSIALMFNGRYEIVLRVDGAGGRVSKTIGMVRAVLDGAAPQHVTVAPDADAVRDALAELRARPTQR